MLSELWQTGRLKAGRAHLGLVRKNIGSVFAQLHLHSTRELKLILTKLMYTHVAHSAAERKILMVVSRQAAGTYSSTAVAYKPVKRIFGRRYIAVAVGMQGGKTKRHHENQQEGCTKPAEYAVWFHNAKLRISVKNL